MIIDNVTKQEGKEFVQRTNIKTEKIVAVVAKNHFLTVVYAQNEIIEKPERKYFLELQITFCPLIYLGYKLSPYEPLKVSEDTPFWFLWSYFLDGFIFEVIFYLGHYLEHLSPDLYRKYHLLHHTSKADMAFSGYKIYKLQCMLAYPFHNFF